MKTQWPGTVQAALQISSHLTFTITVARTLWQPWIYTLENGARSAIYQRRQRVSAGLGSERAPDFRDSTERPAAAFFCLGGLAGCWLADGLLTKRVMWFGQDLTCCGRWCFSGLPLTQEVTWGQFLESQGLNPGCLVCLLSFPASKPNQALSFTRALH